MVARALLLALAVSAIALTDARRISQALPQQPARRPNILLFFPDELRHDWVNNGSHSDFLRTPHIDSLRERGLKFDHAITASPLCGPSRASFAAVSNYEEVGVLGNYYDFPVHRLVTYYKLLQDAGYHTMAVGKLDLAKNETLHGYGWGHNGTEHAREWGFSRQVNAVGVYESSVLTTPDATGSYVEPYTDFLLQYNLTQTFLQDVHDRVDGTNDGHEALYKKTSPNTLPDAVFNDNWVADQAVRLLLDAPADQPWFLQVNWNGPHYPMSVTQRMWESVQGRTYPQPYDYHGDLSPDDHNKTRGGYAALIENIDRQIGWILEHVNASETVVVLASDHGEMMGDHGIWSKSVPYHQAIGVPLIVAGDVLKQTLQGKTTKTAVSLIDLARTFLDIANVSSVPTQMAEARSFLPVLQGQRLPRQPLRSALST